MPHLCYSNTIIGEKEHSLVGAFNHAEDISHP